MRILTSLKGQRELRLATYILLLSLPIVSPIDANAYERSRTDEGALSSWFTHCIPIGLNQRGSAKIPLAQVELEIERASLEWEGPTCSTLELVYTGITTTEEVGFDPTPNAENENILLFQNAPGSWIHDPRAVGLTTVTMCQNDTPVCAMGTIIDADIEFNEVHFELDISSRGAATMDFGSTLTHELGHLIGLDHSADPEATMYAESAPGETKKRTINADDAAGVCDAFAVSTGLRCILSPYDIVNGISSAEETDPVFIDDPSSDSGCTQRVPIYTQGSAVSPLRDRLGDLARLMWLVLIMSFIYIARAFKARDLSDQSLRRGEY